MDSFRTGVPTRHGYGRAFMETERLAAATLSPPRPWSKGCPLLKVPALRGRYDMSGFGTLLFDTFSDPAQERPIDRSSAEGRVLEARMTELLIGAMEECGAPGEQYEWLGLR